MTLGLVDANGNISRNPLAPNAPTFAEMYEKVNNKKLSGDDLEAFYSIAAAWSQASKSMLLPENTRTKNPQEKIRKNVEIFHLRFGVFQMTADDHRVKWRFTITIF